jgi:primosomal protein N' (replication factor Y)
VIPKYVTVIFPLALPKLYTYAVPPEMAADIVTGIRVEVSLKNKLYSALVAEVYEDIELAYKPKAIISIIDNLPMVTAIQLQFWKWMAEYYCCTIGEVMNVAMPSGLKLESETKVVFNGNFEDIDQALSDDEYLIAEAVSTNPGNLRQKNGLSDIKKSIGQKDHLYQGRTHRKIQTQNRQLHHPE